MNCIRRKRLVTILKLFLMLAVLMTVSSCSDSETDMSESVRPVRYTEVIRSGLSQNRVFAGSAQAGTNATLSFRVGGILEQLKVTVGQKITKGSFIAVVENSDTQLRFEEAKAALEASLISKQTAQANLQRVKSLYENNTMSVSDYDVAKSDYASSNAIANSKQKAVNLLENELNYATLLSPMDGIVTEILVSENEAINPGQPVTVISSETDLEVAVGIPEAFIGQINEGATVSVKFSAVPDELYDGVITEISFVSDPKTSTYRVTILLSEVTSHIRPGMPADVSFSLGNATDAQALIIPSSAVINDLAGSYVFTIQEQSDQSYSVNKQQVSTGSLTPEGFEILSGLQEGDLIVTAGVRMLTEGAKVSLYER